MRKMSFKHLTASQNKLKEISLITNLGFGDVYDRLFNNIEYQKYGFKSEIVCPKTGNLYKIFNVRNKTIFSISIKTDYVNGIAATEELTRYIVTHKTKLPEIMTSHNRYLHIGNLPIGYINEVDGNTVVEFDDAIADKLIEHSIDYNPLNWTCEDIVKLR